MRLQPLLLEALRSGTKAWVCHERGNWPRKGREKARGVVKRAEIKHNFAHREMLSCQEAVSAWARDCSAFPKP